MRTLLLLALAAALLTAGCGDSASDTPATSAADKPARTTATAQQSGANAGAEDRARAKAARQLRRDARSWRKHMRDSWAASAEAFPKAQIVTESDYSVEDRSGFRELVIQTDYYPDSDFDEGADWGCGVLTGAMNENDSPVAEVDNAVFLARDGTRRSCGGA